MFLIENPSSTFDSVCVCVVSGVPWMDAMLQSVREERQLYSHNQCVQYRCTHSRGHNIDMNRAGILAWTSALHGHSKFLSQVFQVGFWCCKKQIWSTHWVDWEDNLKMKMTSKMKTIPITKTTSKMKKTSRRYIDEAHTALNIFPPAPPIWPLSS